MDAAGLIATLRPDWQAIAAIAAAVAAIFSAVAAWESRQAAKGQRHEHELLHLREIHELVAEIVDVDGGPRTGNMLDRMTTAEELRRRLRAALNACAVDLPECRLLSEPYEPRDPADPRRQPDMAEALAEAEKAILMHTTD